MEDCVLLNAAYVGQTRNTLSKRITYHLQDGAVKDHLSHSHKASLTRQHLEDNISVIKEIKDYQRLIMYEALTIMKLNPTINRQKDNFYNPLKLFAQSQNMTNSNDVPIMRVQEPSHNNADNERTHTYSLRSCTLHQAVCSPNRALYYFYNQIIV